jgi:hypothetical protein
MAPGAVREKIDRYRLLIVQHREAMACVGNTINQRNGARPMNDFTHFTHWVDLTQVLEPCVKATTLVLRDFRIA